MFIFYVLLECPNVECLLVPLLLVGIEVVALEGLGMLLAPPTLLALLLLWYRGDLALVLTVVEAETAWEAPLLMVEEE